MPCEVFGECVTKGWRATVVERDKLELAWSKIETRKVKAGGVFEVDGEEYRHDWLLDRVGLTMILRRPLFGDQSAIHVCGDTENFIVGRAERVPLWRADDLAGARWQGEQRGKLNAVIRAMRAETSRVDPMAEAERRRLLLPGPPAPNEPDRAHVDVELAGPGAVPAGPPEIVSFSDAQERQRRQTRRWLKEAERQAG
jgi:hypothetical protein